MKSPPDDVPPWTIKHDSPKVYTDVFQIYFDPVHCPNPTGHIMNTTIQALRQLCFNWLQMHTSNFGIHNMIIALVRVKTLQSKLKKKT